MIQEIVEIENEIRDLIEIRKGTASISTINRLVKENKVSTGWLNILFRKAR